MFAISGALINIPAANSDMRKNTKLMEEGFASLLVTASIELRKLGVPVGEVVLYLTSLKVSTHKQMSHYLISTPYRC